MFHLFATGFDTLRFVTVLDLAIVDVFLATVCLEEGTTIFGEFFT